MRRLIKKYWVEWLSVLLILTLSGCGSGGGGDGGGSTGGETVKKVTLTVDSFGKGAVSSTVPGIDCGNDCSETFPVGTTVELTAVPGDQWEFRSWAGCESVTGPSCTVVLNSDRTVFPTFGQTDLTTAPNTKILDTQTVQNLLQQNGTTYYFDSQASQVLSLQNGDLMAHGIGEGLLRKVIDVRTLPNGRIAVETSSATLEEAVQSGTLSFTKTLTNADIVSAKALKPGVRLSQAPVRESSTITYTIDAVLLDADNDFETTADQVRASGSVTFIFDPDFALDIGFFSINEFKTVFIVKSEQDLTLEVGTNVSVIDKKIDIYETFFAPIPVSPFLAVVPKVTLSVGANGEIQASLTGGIVVDATYTAGVHYLKGRGWRPVGDVAQEIGFANPDISGGGGMKGFVGPEMLLLLNGIAGPHANLEGYLRILADLFASPWWSLYGGVSASAGAKVEVLSFLLAEYEANLFDVEWLLADSEGSIAVDPSNDNVPPTVPFGLAAASISSTQVDLFWEASQSDGDLAGYRVYRDGFLVRTTAERTFSDTGLNQNTEYCYTVSAFDAAGNESGQSLPACVTTASNSPPILSNGKVTPSSGDAATTFVYEVAYTDPDNDPPASGYPRIHILKDGLPLPASPFPMNCSGTEYNSGVTCSTTIQLGVVGSGYTFYFEASDGLDTVYLPASGEFNGPVVDQGTEPELLYGVDSVSNLFTFDTGNKTVDIIGPTGFSYLGDIAMAPNGTLYGCTLVFLGHSSLVRIDPSTGGGTLIGTIGFGEVNALAFDSLGTLYGSTAQGELLTIDPSTGQGTSVGFFGGGLLSSGDLASAPGLGLFGVGIDPSDPSSGEVLLHIDRSSGAATVLGPIGFNQVFGLAFGKDGLLYGGTGASSEIITIDPFTGTGTLFSSTNLPDINGLATLPVTGRGSISEP